MGISATWNEGRRLSAQVQGPTVIHDKSAVTHTEQSLTDEQKTQARLNIGAASVDELEENKSAISLIEQNIDRELGAQREINTQVRDDISTLDQNVEQLDGTVQQISDSFRDGAAVLTTEQALTDGQKAQARANIGAASNSDLRLLDEFIRMDNGVVLVSPQGLTDQQAQQARENIGAVNHDYVDAEIDSLHDDIEGIERDLSGVINNIIGIEQTIEEYEANIAKNSEAIAELQKTGGGGGHYEIGKNKFNIATVTNGCYLPAPSDSRGKAGQTSITIAHEQFKTSDWIPVTGGESYIFSYTGTRYGFSIHCTDDNGVLVADAIGANRDIAFTIPDGATKLRFSGRIEVFDSGTLQLEQGTVVTDYEPYTETYVGGTDFSGVEKYPPLLEVIDQKIAESGGSGEGHHEIGKNKFNAETITTGKFIYPADNTAGGSVVLRDNAEFGTSDWVAVEEGESYVLSANGMSQSQVLAFVFADNDETLVANGNAEKATIAFTIPTGCTKVRFSCKLTFLQSGTLQLEKGTTPTDYEEYAATYVSGVDFSGVQFYEPLLEVIDEKVLTAKYFTGKKAMFFGDSITDPDYGYHRWTLQVAENTGLTIVENFAISGSKLCHTERAEPTGEHETANKKSVVNQVQYLLNNSANYDTPDIIVIFAATNDNLATDENDMNFLESIARYDEAQFTCELAGCDLMSFSGAMRWIYERLTGLYPNVSIVYVTPLQSASDRRSYAVQKQKRDAIIEICERLAMDYIDAFRLSGIYDGYEIDEASGKYLVDGLHPNADGIVKISKCVTNGLNNIYYKL